MSSCKIHLDEHQDMYYAGEVIEGRVVCSIVSTKTIRGIDITLAGEEQNEWYETENYYDNHDEVMKTRRVKYSGHNVFLVVENKLCAEGEVGPGTLEFPFTFKLPLNIPGTFQGPYGGVSFSLTAKMDRLPTFCYTDHKIISVASSLDLNGIREQLQLQPVSYSDDRTPWCYFCFSSLVTMEVHLEKEVFVPGETIKIKVDIDNTSNVDIHDVGVELTGIFESRITNPSDKFRTDRIVLAMNHTARGVTTGYDKKTFNLDLKIPETAPVANFSLCRLFKYSNELKVTAKIGGCYEDLDVTTSVTLGHIPICDFPLGEEGNQNQVPYPPTLPNQAPRSYPLRSPPAYAKPPVAVGQIGFTSSANRHPQSPSNALPYPPAGPSAPPPEDSASALTNREDRGGGFEEEDPAPPPSYSEAMGYSPRQ